MSDNHYGTRCRRNDGLVPPGSGIALAFLAGLAGALMGCALWLAGAGLMVALLAWLTPPQLVLVVLITLMDRAHLAQRGPRLTNLREARNRG